MYATALIVFREVFEAALVISLVLAASRGLPGRGRWVAAGVAAGVLGAGIVAGFARTLAALAEGMGQEVFNASVVFLAAGFLGWHNVWMSRHGRQLADRVSEVGKSVAAGSRPLSALAAVAGLAVLREGAEVVLFVYGIAVSEGARSGPMLAGGVTGLLGGIAVGVALYLGLLRIPTRHLFAVTGWMIILLAAGMASQGTAFLVQAGMLPALGETVWDTSWLIPQKSIGGQLLHALIGYADRPDGIQVLAYAVTALGIGALMMLLGGGRNSRRPGRVSTALVLCVLTMLAGASPARADFTVHMPLVVKGEREVEAAYTRTQDASAALDQQQVYNLAVGYGATSWWLTELEAQWERPPREDTQLNELAWENTFQLTEPGEYWLNLGLFAEYARPQHSAERPNVKLGPILQMQYETALHTVNLFFERQVGPHAGTAVEFTYAWQSRFRVTRSLDAGFEIFGAPGEAGKPLPYKEQDVRAGPVLYGQFKPSARTKVQYQLGYLLGATDATPGGTWKLNVELEF